MYSQNECLMLNSASFGDKYNYCCVCCMFQNNELSSYCDASSVVRSICSAVKFRSEMKLFGKNQKYKSITGVNQIAN